MAVCTNRVLPFSELDFDSVNFEAGNFSWGRGGRGLRNDQYTITEVDENLNQKIYVLPECIAHIIKTSEKWAVNECQEKIKNALGI